MRLTVKLPVQAWRVQTSCQVVCVMMCADGRVTAAECGRGSDLHHNMGHGPCIIVRCLVCRGWHLDLDGGKQGSTRSSGRRVLTIVSTLTDSSHLQPPRDWLLSATCRPSLVDSHAQVNLLDKWQTKNRKVEQLFAYNYQYFAPTGTGEETWTGNDNLDIED